MLALPAVDVRDGQAVQLVGGQPGSERVRLPDPIAVAHQWMAAGFAQLHIIDLDAALGQGANSDVIAGIISDTGLPCQVGGGIRDDDAIRSALDAGAARVIVGTRAVEEPSWLASAARSFPGRLMVAADVRQGQVVTRGWTHDTRIADGALLANVETLPLAGVLVTDVGREGSESGVDVELFRRLAALTRLPLHAAGGIASSQDLHDLEAAGVAGAVLGMALYTGRLEARTTAREFRS